MRKYRSAALLLCFLLLFSACSPAADPSASSVEPAPSSSVSESPADSFSSPQSSAEPSASPTAEPTAEPTPNPDNLGHKVLSEPASVNPLTGMDAGSSSTSARPVAVMINNIKKALPQHGLKDADIVYEIPAEGGITRLLAIYQDISKAGVIGSVRSSRAIFIDVARSYDAIYVHHGGSPEAYTMIKQGLVTSIDGMNSGATFYRDAWRRANMGYEHSSMTTGSNLVKRISALAKKGTRTEKKSTENAFRFTYSDFVPAGGAATKVSVKTGSYTSVYEYVPSSGTYIRTQNGYNYDNNGTGKLDFRNVFVLQMKYSEIPGDDKGRLSFENIGSGNGYYFTGGAMMKITWKWSAADSRMRFYDESGIELTVNAGKSFLHFCANLQKTTWS